LALSKLFRLAATGGTFDEIHAGHIALLSKAFDIADKVIIGVTSDEFVKGKKTINYDFNQRVLNLKEMIKREFGNNVNYEIARLDSEFGPAVTTGKVDALITSAETQEKGIKLNEIRRKNDLAPAKIVAVPLIKAEDGKRISSSRIRAGEIDKNGRLLKAG
jgi:pantetheine-phosphate adenylyltransferase